MELTLMRLLSTMYSSMSVERTRRAEALSTNITYMRLVSKNKEKNDVIYLLIFMKE